MWKQSIIKIADDMAPLSCAIVPAHPWIYGLGQLANSGCYLSPGNALGYLSKKLASSGGRGDVIVLMVTENSIDEFTQALNSLAAVFPAPAFTQVNRMAKAAAELSTVKMQLPARVVNALPGVSLLSVSTNRTAINAQRVAAAQIAAAVSTSTAEIKSQLAEFIQTRAGLLSSLSQGMEELRAVSAKLWSFTYTGSHASGAVELLKNIPQTTAVHTAAIMFVGDSLKDLRKMIHESNGATRP